jgi:hypothetical protein
LLNRLTSFGQLQCHSFCTISILYGW